MKYVLTIILILITFKAYAADWFIRSDGGTGSQCDGHTDHALAGATGTNCALNHPNWVFPPRGESISRKASTNDIIVIGSSKSNDKFRIGCQNNTNCLDSSVNLTQSSFCATSYPYDCYMSDGGSLPASVPNGVTIIGCSVSGCSTAADMPEVWGAGQVNQIFNLTNSTNVTVRDIEITDHAPYGNGSPTHSGPSPDGDSLTGRDGIVLTGSSGSVLWRLNVHGLWRDGLILGNIGNLTIKGQTNIEYNALAGLDFDTCNNDGTCGAVNGTTLSFMGDNPSALLSVSHNGCIENYDGVTGKGTIVDTGCYNGNNGGYGDGLGATTTSGNWTFKFVKFIGNTSDGLDLKYCYNAGCTIDIQQSYFGQNAGNQLKTAGSVVAYNNILEGDCDYFEGRPEKSSGMASCNSLGDAYNVNFNTGNTVKFYGNTIINMTGNVAMSIVPRGQTTCTSAESLDIRNLVATSPGRSSILSGGLSGFTDVNSNCSAVVPTQTTSNIYNFNSNPSGSGNVFTNPMLSGNISESIAPVYLSISSPAIGLASENATGQPSYDYNSFSRGSSWDSGALQYGSVYPSRQSGTNYQ